MNYLQVEFGAVKKNQAEILIALLADAGFESFEETENSLLAFIKEDDFEEGCLNEILKIVPVNYAITIVPQQNWNAQWESSFEPILVNNFVAIRAGFHQPVKNVQHEIIITPKMSFGTGHHATTYMMIEQMQGISFTDKAVIDFGTGTGVLAILAEKMGAASVDAIDNDEWSIENAAENVSANNCTNIKLQKAEKLYTDRVYDVILANINLQVIMDNLEAINTIAKKGSVILISGFIKEDENNMLQKLDAIPLYAIKTLQRGNWICIMAERK